MNTIVLWFALLWPFHHHKAAVPVDPNSPCQQNAEGYYFFLGPDNQIGVSQDSCGGALHNWLNAKPIYIEEHLI